MKLKKIIIHIGAEKTGSTTIQNFLFLNKNVLKDAGVYFLQSQGKKNHSIIPKVLSEKAHHTKQGEADDSLKKEVAEIKKNIEREVHSEAVGCHTLIISSEHFHSKLRTQREIERVKGILPESDKVEILFYVRRQDRVCLSLYSTKIGAGGTKDFKFPSVNSNLLPYRYDYNAAYELWSDVFGAGSVVVNIFDNIIHDNNGLLGHLCAYLGIHEDCHASVGQMQNRSLDINGLYLMKIVNRMGLGRIEFISIRRLVLDNFSQGEKFRPFKEEAIKFQKKFEFSNAELSRKVLDNPHKNFFDDNYDFYLDKERDVEQSEDSEFIIKNILKNVLKNIRNIKT